jgi:hypothetical protein
MKTKMITLGAALLAITCFWSSQGFAQTSTTVTTTNGAFTEYVPGSETMVVRSEVGTSPLRYSVTKQTTIVTRLAPQLQSSAFRPAVSSQSSTRVQATAS